VPRNDETRIVVPPLIAEGIAANTTAYLEITAQDNIQTLGNPTEGALLLWLHDNGIDYLPLRENAKVIEQLTFSTERKYMATLVQSPLFGKKVIYVKGAPEIVLGMCNDFASASEKAEVEAGLLEYQSKAMRTLGFAYKIVEDGLTDARSGQPVPVKKDNGCNTHIICDALTREGEDASAAPVANNDKLTFLGFVAISDPVRQDVPAAVASCIAAGIDIKIVTGDTSATAIEIGRQIGLWKDNEPSSHHITGAEFAEADDDNLLERVEEIKIMSRARPMDKQRLVQLLQKRGEVVAVTGDGTNDAPALNAAQVGLSVGDGTFVAKEASDITIIDNSFNSISRAVMWGRSLYQNIQRFILFQMTINIAACIIVLTGAFIGTESPLTVTQMLWVNLIMDTFAALALASLPPNEGVMKDKPRKTTDFIISQPMWARILSIGLLFVLVMFGFLQYFRHFNIEALNQFNISDFCSGYFNFRGGSELTSYELSLFFTLFVLLQFWNMFNAKALKSGKSAFANMSNSSGFMLIAAVILAGQWLIVTTGGEMFNVVPLSAQDWGLIIGGTSIVLWAGEALRLIRKYI
jgi:Ca2+-transporting ATPase